MVRATYRRRRMLAVTTAAAIAVFVPLLSSAGPALPAPLVQPAPLRRTPPSLEPRTMALTSGQRQALQAGIQVSAKRGADPVPSSWEQHAAAVTKPPRAQPDPYLASLPDPSTADYSGWRRTLAARAERRTGSRALRTASSKAAEVQPAPLVHDEAEPSDVGGVNDSLPTAEPLADFGTGRSRNPRAQVLGTLADLRVAPVPIAPGAEDNGQLDEATDSTINGTGAVSTTGVIGDGPHGSEGTMTGDFDFYRLQVSAGLTVTIDTAGSDVDTVVALYDATGKLLGVNDDLGGVPGPSHLVQPVPGAGTYFAMVAGFSTAGTLPRDPHDAGSGNGGGTEGAYNLTLTASVVDADYYGVDLVKGDVLGATVVGAASTLTVFRPDGRQMVGASRLDTSALYPPQSPLPGGGNTTLAYVAEGTGRYAVRVDGPPGGYDATVEAYRPGAEGATYGQVQTLFLDVDGARPNTAIWGGPGVRTLSPLAAFVGKWGLEPDQEGELVRQLTNDVRANLGEVRTRTLTPDVTVRVVSSRTSPDAFGHQDVSRVILGGTRDEAGLNAIGMAQFIDPGNFAHEDSAVVLLDLLSAPCAGDGVSLNCYLSTYGDRLSFVAQALANVISHEDGHLIGSYHTDDANSQLSLMDPGELDFQNLYGAGGDRVGGTEDDPRVEFVTDDYLPAEGYSGWQNTRSVAAWAYVKGRHQTTAPR